MIPEGSWRPPGPKKNSVVLAGGAPEKFWDHFSTSSSAPRGILASILQPWGSLFRYVLQHFLRHDFQTLLGSDVHRIFINFEIFSWPILLHFQKRQNLENHWKQKHWTTNCFHCFWKFDTSKKETFCIAFLQAFSIPSFFTCVDGFWSHFGSILVALGPPLRIMLASVFGVFFGKPSKTTKTALEKLP